MVLYGAQQTAGIGQPWLQGVLAAALIPPARNVPRLRVLHGEEAGKNSQRCDESKAAAKQALRRSRTSKLAPTRQEHLDAIVSFAGVGQRRRLFRGLGIIPNKWAIFDLLEECRFFLNTQLMFLNKEKDTPNLFVRR